MTECLIADGYLPVRVDLRGMRGGQLDFVAEFSTRRIGAAEVTGWFTPGPF